MITPETNIKGIIFQLFISLAFPIFYIRSEYLNWMVKEKETNKTEVIALLEYDRKYCIVSHGMEFAQRILQVLYRAQRNRKLQRWK